MHEDEDLFDQVYQTWFSMIGSLDGTLEADTPSSGIEGSLDLFLRTGIGFEDRVKVATDVSEQLAAFISTISAVMPDLNRAFHAALDVRDQMEIERDDAVAGLFEQVAKIPPT